MTADSITSVASVSVVVPVYNSEEILYELVARLETALRKLSVPFEAVLVNDGSRDHSWDVIWKLSGQYDWVHGINLMRNYGQHNALLCGIRAAKNEVTVTIDDDLQNPPEEIFKLLTRLGEGYEVVYGTPEKKQHGYWRNLASWTTKLVLQSAMGAETARSVSAFRAFRTKLRAAFDRYESPFVSIDALLTWGASSFAAVSVRHDPRPRGVSGYNFRKLALHALDMMTGFSTFPMQLASIVGFAFTMFGVAVLAYVLGIYLTRGGTVPGFTFLASIVSIFSGAQLFALGILGEYLARMHFRTMGRPPYVVHSRTRELNGT
jgi:undecaprenyl-phosphate 4-deoxy-4-formamido-L-arabinose transferase